MIPKEIEELEAQYKKMIDANRPKSGEAGITLMLKKASRDEAREVLKLIATIRAQAAALERIANGSGRGSSEGTFMFTQETVSAREAQAEVLAIWAKEGK